MATSTVLLCTLHIINVIRFNGVYTKPAAPEKGQSLDIDSRSLELLSKYGYYLQPKKGVGELQNSKQVASALRRFQGFAGIPVTGKLDTLTKEYMVKPRCGMPDLKIGRSKRIRRYNLQGSQWRKLRLTWALENSNNDGITDYEVRHIMTMAFHKWSSVTNLVFIELVNRPENTADLRVRFVRGDHGDPYPFDGLGNVIAHAFYPQGNTGLAGDIHFDDDELFTINAITSRYQKKIMWVAVHEIGHAIGLEHSRVQGAIMWPYYQHFETNDFDLSYDDITGIQRIYGGKINKRKKRTTVKPVKPVKPVTPTPVVRTPLTKLPRNDKCVNTIDAAFIGRNKQLNFINNNKLYVLYNASREGIEKGPLPISDYFSNLKKVDAVFLHPYFRSHTIFHGNTFSVYEENKVKYGRKRYIRYGFQRIKEKLENVDAAIVWPNTGKLYIFKGEKYWRLREIPRTRDYSAERGYPKNIAQKWNGLPKTIDSAFVWTNDKIYFTKGDLYYRWDERKHTVHAGYPIKLTRSFLKCDVN